MTADPSDLRILRDRQASREGDFDRAQAGAYPSGNARQLVQVVDLGSMPSAGDRYFAAHPAAIDCPEAEGSPCAPVADTSSVLMVDFLRNAPSVGDLAVATAVGGRWVAEVGGTPRANVTVQAAWCNSICVPPGIVAIVIRSGACPGGAVVAAGTANSFGACKFTLPPGTYCASASTTTAGYLNTPTTFTVPASGTFHVGTPLIPAAIQVTDSALGIKVRCTPQDAAGTIYQGTATADAPATFCCGAASVPLSYAFFCLGITCAAPQINVSVPTDDSSGYPCPAASGTLAIGEFCFPGSPCYPLNLSQAFNISNGAGSVPLYTVSGSLQDVYGVVRTFVNLFGSTVCSGGATTVSPPGITTTLTITQTT